MRCSCCRRSGLSAQQQKLVQLYYRDAVSEEVLKAEQQRIKREKASVQQRKAVADFEAADTMQALDEALSLIDQASVPYLMAGSTERRLLNQALYEAIYVEDECGSEAVEADFHPLYGLLAPVAQDLAGSSPRVPRRVRARTWACRLRKEHDPCSGPCSHVEQMAEGEGFEPSMDSRPCRFSRPVHSTALPPLRDAALRC
jgi:uncharacterized membrane protein YccC